MKFSEILDVASMYRYNVEDSDLNMHVRFGCDCGCGGDLYTSEEWDEMVTLHEETIKQVKQWCKDNNVEYDGYER